MLQCMGLLIGWRGRAQRPKTTVELDTIGLDIGKTTFHLVGLDEPGQPIL
jgi:hypothetical protein